MCEWALAPQGRNVSLELAVRDLGPFNALRVWVLGLVAFLVVLPVAWANPQSIIDPSERAEGLRLESVVSPAGAFHLTQARSFAFELSLEGKHGQSAGVLHLDRTSRDNVFRFNSRHFTMRIENHTSDIGITARLIRAAHRVAAQDGGGWSSSRILEPPLDLDPVRDTTSFVLVVAAALCVYRRERVLWDLRIPHLLPAFIQVVLFAYWSLYWPVVRIQMPVILLQIVLAFALDAALSFGRFGSWRIGASPLPIVLSINLFVWFGPYGMILSILVAFLSKTFVRRKGRHILNPSATGLTVTGLVSYIVPRFTSVSGLFHTMNLPPNMGELVLLLALLPQLRARIVPLSIATVLVMQNRYTNLPPPLLLAIALLATDPATTPETDIGKMLFGLFYGFGFVFASWFLRRNGQIDDFAKVMPIPLANALVPVFDAVGRSTVAGAKRVGRALGQWTAVKIPASFIRPVPNLALVAFWLMITVGRLTMEKPGAFESALHWTYGTPLVVRDADDVPRCADNPIFCQPFSFVGEISAWYKRHRSHPTSH